MGRALIGIVAIAYSIFCSDVSVRSQESGVRSEFFIFPTHPHNSWHFVQWDIDLTQSTKKCQLRGSRTKCQRGGEPPLQKSEKILFSILLLRWFCHGHWISRRQSSGKIARLKSRCYPLFEDDLSFQTHVQCFANLQITALDLKTQPGFAKEIDIPVTICMGTPQVCICQQSSITSDLQTLVSNLQTHVSYLQTLGT